MKKAGIIIELDNLKAVVLTPERKYYNIKFNGNMYISQMVLFDKHDQIKTVKTLYLKIAASVASVIIMIFLSYYFLYPQNEVFAYVGFDSNKSFEVAIDEDYNILNVKKIDNKSKKINELSSIKNKSFKESISLISNQIIETSETTVIMTVFISENYLKSRAANDFITYCKNITNNENIQLVIYLVSPGNRKLAIDNNTSMGKVMLYSDAIDNNVDLSISDIKESSIQELIDTVSRGNNTWKSTNQINCIENSNISDDSGDQTDTDLQKRKNNPIIEDNTTTPKTPSNTTTSDSKKYQGDVQGSENGNGKSND